MTRVGRDAVTESAIPADTDLFMLYVNGKWPSAEQYKGDKSKLVTIDVNGTRPDADVCDIEKGDLTNAEAVEWVKNKLVRFKDGRDSFVPVLYSSRSNLTPLFNDLKAAGYEVGRDFKIWIATLDGKTKTVEDMTGVVAVQWADAKATGHAYDESVVYDDGWKPVKAAVEPIGPTPPIQVGEHGAIVDVTVTYADGFVLTAPK